VNLPVERLGVWVDLRPFAPVEAENGDGRLRVAEGVKERSLHVAKLVGTHDLV